MAFIKRLGWYLVGVSVGLVFLAFILKKKSGEEGIDFCYLPNCRVLKDIRSKTFAFTTTNDTLSFEKLDDDIKKILLNGDIDFGRSKTKTKPCKTYFVTSENENIVLEVKNCPKQAIIKEVYLTKK